MFAPIARLIRQRQAAAAVKLEVENSGLTEDQIATGEEALQLLHLTDHLEDLQRDECLDVLFAVGLNPTLDVLESKLRQLKLHTRHTFTWGELCHVWRLLAAESVNEDQILEQAFMFFDRDGNKEISIAELTTTMTELGGLLTAEEISKFVSIMDTDNNGVVGYEEFLQALRNELPVLAHQQQRGTPNPTPRTPQAATGQHDLLAAEVLGSLTEQTNSSPRNVSAATSAT